MSALRAIGILNDLADVGITMAKIDAAIAADPLITGAVIAKTEEVRDYWKSIAPVNKTGKPHTLKSGYVDEPGDYRDSIKATYEHKASGFFVGRVGTVDYKAHWLEYGSVHNPEYGFAQRTVDHFGGTSIEGGIKSVSA